MLGKGFENMGTIAVFIVMFLFSIFHIMPVLFICFTKASKEAAQCRIISKKESWR